MLMGVVQADELVLEVIYVEIPESELKQFVWELTGEDKTHITSTLGEEDAARLLSDHADQVNRFPLLPLRLGEKTEINEQEPIRFPTEFTLEGEPTTYEERGIGKRIYAELLERKPDSAKVSLFVEEAHLLGWQPYTVEDITVEQPVFSSRNVETTIPVFVDQWIMMGGLVREHEDGEKTNLLILMRVRKP